MSFIVNGLCSVSIISPRTGSTIRLGDLEQGDHFGESVITEKQYSSTVEALIRTELLQLSKFDFDDISKHNPTVTRALADITQQRNISQTLS